MCKSFETVYTVMSSKDWLFSEIGRSENGRFRRMVAFGEWSFGELSPLEIGRSEIGRSEIGRSEIHRSEIRRSENGRCTVFICYVL
jgi:hypothetical protein